VEKQGDFPGCLLLLRNFEADLLRLDIPLFVFVESPEIVLPEFRATRASAAVTVFADPLICELDGLRVAADLARLGLLRFSGVHDYRDGVTGGVVSGKDSKDHKDQESLTVLVRVF